MAPVYQIGVFVDAKNSLLPCADKQDRYKIAFGFPADCTNLRMQGGIRRNNYQFQLPIPDFRLSSSNVAFQEIALLLTPGERLSHVYVS